MTITKLREGIACELRADTRLSGCKIQAAYPAARREFPVVRPIIAVGLDALELEPGLGGFMASCPDGDYYGAPCLLSIRFDIYTSDTVKGPDPCELLEIIFDRLAVTENKFGFFEFRGGRVSRDSNAEANLLTAVGRLRMAVSRVAGDSVVIDGFDVHGRLEADVKDITII